LDYFADLIIDHGETSMTTTDNSFVAQGPDTIGFYANGQLPGPFRGQAPPFKLGALALGHYAGVYGVTDDVTLPLPTSPHWPNAGVVGLSIKQYGVVASSPNNAGLWASSFYSSGVEAHSFSGSAVFASAIDGAGVVGGSNNGAGLYGSSFNGVGVGGSSTKTYGVSGESDLSTGVIGTAGAPGPAVPDPALPNSAGVIGSSDAMPGLIGTSKTGVGVYGFSNDYVGVIGNSANPASYAGYFVGKVTVAGALAATVKNAVVPFPDGTHRLLHCMESPEHWFEDFGAAALRRGRAVVKLDANFAKVIKRGDYRVFLTPEGDCRGLYVRRKSAVSFEVRELMGGKSAIAFSYRIIGWRKDIKGHRRFAKIDTHLPAPPRARRLRPPRRLKGPRPAPAALRALVARMEKQGGAQKQKRRRAR
jgi:hypothetical protein